MYVEDSKSVICAAAEFETFTVEFDEFETVKSPDVAFAVEFSVKLPIFAEAEPVFITDEIAFLI